MELRGGNFNVAQLTRIMKQKPLGFKLIALKTSLPAQGVIELLREFPRV